MSVFQGILSLVTPLNEKKKEQLYATGFLAELKVIYFKHYSLFFMQIYKFQIMDNSKGNE